MFRQLIKALKISVGTSIRSASTTSDAISQIESSIRQAFPRAEIIIVPKYKVTVSAPEFSFQSEKDRHQSVIANIPSEYRDQVEIQTIVDEDSAELVRLELPQSIPLLKLKREEIPATPQIHLDNAVYFLSNGHADVAGECAWLSGSLQLKIYAKAYGIAIKSDDGKKMLVSFINKKFNLSGDFKYSWSRLQLLHVNFYEDIIPCQELEDDLRLSVLFSNQLFDLKASAFSKEEFQDYIKTTLKFGHLFKENTEEPPGNLPLLGHLWMLDKEKPFETIDRLSKQLGDVFSMNFGNERVVVISRDRLFREAFLKDGHNFSGRPSLFVHESCWGKGHVINDGPETVEMRRFFGNFIRQKLQGKSGKSLQEIVDEEVEQMVQRVDTNLAKGENQLDIEDAVFYAIGNVMTRLILGRSCPHGSEEFRQSAAWLKTTTELMERTAPLTFLPWLRYFPFKGFGYWEMKKQARKVNQMMMDDIKMRRQTKEYLNQSNNDLTANLLRKVDEIKQNGLQKKDPSLKCYSDEMTAKIMTEMFFAGIQTECGTFSWAFLYLVEFPDVQERLRGLIHKTFGHDGKVHWSERQKIPYLEATVMEVQRCANIAPFGIFHRNRQEAILDGYQIPKDSIILMNIWSTMRDFQLFPEPEKFNPERFLTKDGSEIDKDSLHGLYPYGIGPRICLGESIARCELFTVIGTLLQKYRFRKIPNVEYNMERKMQLIIQPDAYKLVIERVC